MACTESRCVRESAAEFINLFSVMLAANIGEEDDGHGGGSMKLDESALKTLRDKFNLEDEDEVAAASFRRKIDRALKRADALQKNWLFNTVGQEM